MSLKEITKLDEVLVFKNKIEAGKLFRTKRGACFKYSENYLKSDNPKLSFFIDKNKKDHEINGENLHPFFAGLLPEGLRLNSLVNTLKTSSSDLFSILIASGSDIIGDVYIKTNNDEVEENNLINDLDYSTNNFYDLLDKSVTLTALNNRDKNPSIPGIQPKLSSQMISFPVKIANKKKRYILKLEPKECPNLVLNEYYFMNLAKSCGIEVANTQIVKDSDGNSGLLVERFDRAYNKTTNTFQRYHQEDACQFLNLYPQDKYRVNLREIAKGIEEFVRAPVIEISKLINLQIFSYLICNGDMHAKNISLMYEKDPTNIFLTPAYDLLSTLPYGDDSMALDFEGKNKNFTKEMFYNFGEAFNVPKKVVDKSIKQISENILKNIEAIKELGFSERQSKHLIKTIETRVKSLA